MSGMRRYPFMRVQGRLECSLAIQVGAQLSLRHRRGNAFVIAGDSFTIDDAGVRIQAGQ